ncbi:phage tail tube protein [Amycolatopsis kentuckyensis]|uniref:phage tail tube protein n=1 Tax=Amycolatopsis kentuckyensis TaxID=218823 RepID=UPI003565C9CE
MPTVKINARDIIIQVAETNGTTWTPIGGLNSAVPNAGENEEVVDTTTFDSAGNYEQEVIQRGATLALEGFLLKDPANGAQDPGQARVEALATQVGFASVGKIRFRHPVDTQWKVWNATFSLGEHGGGNNDKYAWVATVTRSGPSTTVAVSASVAEDGE